MPSLEWLFDRCDRRGPDECWPWKMRRDEDGYGVANNPARSGTKIRAHRAVYVAANGPIEPGLVVMHTCDNPPCVNPRHLQLGTNEENLRDMTQKGRRVRPPVTPGESNPAAKLTEEQVVEIIADNRPQTHIARDYGVSRSTIGLIKKGKLWPKLPR